MLVIGEKAATMAKPENNGGPAQKTAKSVPYTEQP